MKFFDSSVDYSKLTFGSPVKSADGKYFISTLHENDQVLVRFNSWLTCNTNLMMNNEKASQIDVTLKIPEYIETVRDFEENLLQKAKELKDEWFPEKGITNEYLDSAFMSSLKPIKKSQDHVMKIRTSREMEAYTNDQKEIELSDVKENSEVGLIVNMQGLWFTKTRFGIVWKIMQIKLKKPKTKREYMFDDDDNVDDDNLYPDVE